MRCTGLKANMDWPVLAYTCNEEILASIKKNELLISIYI